MYKYKKIAEKAPNRRFDGVLFDSLIIVRGALEFPLGLWEISGAPSPELGCRDSATAGREPAEPAAEATAGRAGAPSPVIEKHKKNTPRSLYFSTFSAAPATFFRYFPTLYNKKGAGLWEISGFLHTDSIYVYSLHFPIYGCIKACIKKTIREALQILHLSECVLCIHGDFYIKMEPKCMYIQCMFMH